MKRGKVSILLLLIVIILIIVYWNIPYSPFQSKFVREMKQRVEVTKESDEYCTAEEIAALPEPLQRYCEYAGILGFKKYQVARTGFENSKFVFDVKSGKILNMDYDLWLFYNEPFRSAYCSSSMYGIPFDGVDYCTVDDKGGMRGIVGKTVKIFDVCSSQGYQAQLISWFAESMTLNPSVLFSPYVTYEEGGDRWVKVKISNHGISGTGIITVDRNGAITEFYSEDRQVEVIDGVDTRIGWRCEYENYALHNGILQAETVRSIKIFPDKKIVYFDSNHFTTQYIK